MHWSYKSIQWIDKANKHFTLQATSSKLYSFKYQIVYVFKAWDYGCQKLGKSTLYRVSHKTRPNLFSWISRLSDHLELKVRTFSNSPVNSLQEIVQLYRWKITQIIDKLMGIIFYFSTMYNDNFQISKDIVMIIYKCLLPNSKRWSRISWNWAIWKCPYF